MAAAAGQRGTDFLPGGAKAEEGRGANDARGFRSSVSALGPVLLLPATEQREQPARRPAHRTVGPHRHREHSNSKQQQPEGYPREKSEATRGRGRRNRREMQRGGPGHPGGRKDVKAQKARLIVATCRAQREACEVGWGRTSMHLLAWTRLAAAHAARRLHRGRYCRRISGGGGEREREKARVREKENHHPHPSPIITVDGRPRRLWRPFRPRPPSTPCIIDSHAWLGHTLASRPYFQYVEPCMGACQAPHNHREQGAVLCFPFNRFTLARQLCQTLCLDWKRDLCGAIRQRAKSTLTPQEYSPACHS